MARHKRYYQTGKSHRRIDKKRRAKKVGWRTSKRGRKYFENRRNRSDRQPKSKL